MRNTGWVIFSISKSPVIREVELNGQSKNTCSHLNCAWQNVDLFNKPNLSLLICAYEWALLVKMDWTAFQINCMIPKGIYQYSHYANLHTLNILDNYLYLTKININRFKWHCHIARIGTVAGLCWDVHVYMFTCMSFPVII